MFYTGKLHNLEFVIVQCLRILIREGRLCSSSTLILSSVQGFQVLRFITYFIGHFEENFLSIHRFNDFCQYFIKECPGCDSFIVEIEKALHCANLNQFFDEIEGLKGVLTDVSVSSSNGSRTISLICPESYLGYFCRSFLARFESIPFEGICQYFDDLQIFCTATSNGSLRKIPTKNIVVEDHDDVDDVSMAEDILHRLFDTDHQYALPQLAAISTPLSTALESFRCAVESADVKNAGSFVVTPGTQMKHQYAMLALSVLWVKQSFHTLAFYSLEEAMKIAHQRGDHRTVAQAVLLLHYIVNASQSTSDVFSSSLGTQKSSTECFDEELLIRCIQRCIDSKQRYLSSQCAILLVNLRSQRKLRGVSNHFDNERVETVHVDGVSVETLWALLRVSLFGDSKATLAIARSGDYTESTEHSTGQDGQLRLMDGGLLSVAELNEFLLSHTVASMNVWERLGQIDMAFLETRRYLRHMLMTEASLPNTNWESLCLFLCKSLRCVVDKYIPLSAIPFTIDASYTKHVGRVFVAIQKVSLCFESIVTKRKRSNAVINAMRSVKLFIDARKYIFMLTISSHRSSNIDGRYQRISETALKAAMSYRDFCHEMTIGNGLLHQNSIHDTTTIQERIESDILVAITMALAHSSASQACEILSQIVLVYENNSSLRKLGLLASVFLSFLRLNQLTQGNEDGSLQANILAELEKLLFISRKEVYPRVEQLILQSFTYLGDYK